MTHSLRIAVADDEPDMRDYFQKSLTRLGHDLVAQPRQDFREVVAHVRLVVGDGDAQRLIHDGSRGRRRRISAPRPAPGPTAIWPPWASTMRLAIAMPSPVPLVLVV